jgi:hypothetical protein
MHDPTKTILRFGKYCGHDVRTVPVGYLIWFLGNARKVPPEIMHELRRRSGQTNRDGLEAQSALSRWTARLARNCGHKRKPSKKNDPAGRRRQPSSSDRQRTAALQLLDRLKAGVMVVGQDFERLRQEFEAAGGDPAECPFDVPGHPYVGDWFDAARQGCAAVSSTPSRSREGEPLVFKLPGDGQPSGWLA